MKLILLAAGAVIAVAAGTLPLERAQAAGFVFAGGKWGPLFRHRCCGNSPDTFHLIRGNIEKYENGRILRYTIIASQDESPVSLKEGDEFLAAGVEIRIPGFGTRVFVPIIIVSLPHMNIPTGTPTATPRASPS